ncbi:hypothetical protein LTR28_006066 [Elasticomyces elasticus]|nr:hypothetical protein LTR28_006066 [Elasticomyces elasticus]
MQFAHEYQLRPSDAMDAFVDHVQKAEAQNSSQPQAPDQLGGPALNQQAQQLNHPHLNLPPNNVPPQIPPGARTPGTGQMPPNINLPTGQQSGFASPSMPNLGLPLHPNGTMPPHMNGSPHVHGNSNLGPGGVPNAKQHTPSPAQVHMAAPSMVPQHSAQGTNSSVASANASPNVSGKRRRSTVKVEDEGGGEIVQAQRVKASPRVGHKKGKAG